MKDVRRLAQEQIERDKQAGIRAQPLVSFGPVDRQPLSDKGAEGLISMTFASSSDGPPHVVTVWHDATGTAYTNCTCAAMRNIEMRPTGCWALQEFRKVVGIHAP